MKVNKILKITVDILMTIIMIILMGYDVTGNLIHEILGITVFTLFIIHCILNRKWFSQLSNQLNNKNLISIIWITVNLLLAIDMIMLAVSSIFIARSTITVISYNIIDMSPWIYIHRVGAYIGLILVSVHLGLHWNMIMNMSKKMFRLKEVNKIRTFILRVIALVLAILGVKSSFDRGIAMQLIPDSVTESSDDESESQSSGSSSDVVNANDSSNLQLVGSRSRGGQNDNNSSSERTFTETIEDGESLDDFLSGLTCTACGRHCLLSSPACQRGEAQAESATEYYNSYDDSDSTTDSEDSTLDDSTSEDDSSVTQDDSSVTQDDNEDDSESLNDYLGSLYCNGCGKHCSLLTPRCSVGEEQASEATEEYYASVSTEENASDESESDTVVIQGDEDSFVAVFGDYIPIMGLYIAGTHYSLEFLKKKKRKKLDN